MTDRDFEFCMSYWKIPLLEKYTTTLEDAFELEIPKHYIKRNFINVLIRSYAHSLLVTKEILCLIRNGFPDGALARARRIYEDMIIALYLNDHKDDADFGDVIARYFDDQNVRAYAGRQQYAKIVQNQLEIAANGKKLNDIVRQYASSPNDIYKKRNEILTNNYWWVHNRTTSFNELSKCCENPYAKLMYQRACYSIHASAMGDVSLLGRPNADGTKLYSGATYNGFALPLALTVFSLGHITEIVFGNLQANSPVSNEKFIELMHCYLKNSDEEMKEQSNV